MPNPLDPVLFTVTPLYVPAVIFPLAASVVTPVIAPPAATPPVEVTDVAVSAPVLTLPVVVIALPVPLPPETVKEFEFNPVGVLTVNVLDPLLIELAVTALAFSITPPILFDEAVGVVKLDDCVLPELLIAPLLSVTPPTVLLVAVAFERAPLDPTVNTFVAVA